MRCENMTYRVFRSTSFFLFLCAVMLLPLAVSAQSPGTSASAPTQTDACLQDSECSDLVTSARNLSQAGQYEAALVAYQSAYAKSKAFWLLVNIGRMQQKAGRPQQAMITYQRLLGDAAVDAETQSKAREYVHQLEQEALVQPAVLGSAKTMSQAKPVYKKWWFWTAVGSATAVVAVGLAIGLTPRSPSVPPGENVYNTVF